MRSITLALMLAAGITTVATASEPKKPLAQWTCADFIGVEEDYRPKLVYWATAYSKAGKPESAMVDVAGTEKVIPIVTEDCKRSPQESFWQKLEDGWKRVEGDVKGDIKGLEKKL